MLINEHKLSMLKAEDRQLLEDAMIGFLFEGKEVTVEGYVPKA
jgi:Fe-S cluster biosynthesis and repair protein YggX